jgi:hypothetical protein
LAVQLREDANLADLLFGINREHHSRKLAVSTAIPLLFACSAEKFPCLADLIPQLPGTAEFMSKPLI